MNHILPTNNEIAAILPIYTASGNSTQLLLTNGEEVFSPFKAATIIRRLAYRQTIDLLALKAKATQITQSTIWQPLVLAPDLVLVPLKTRSPKISGDATGGYINFPHIVSIKSIEKSTRLHLTGNHFVTSLWKLTTVQMHLRQAHLFLLNESFTKDRTQLLQDKLLRMWLENPSNNFAELLRIYAMNRI